MADELSFEEEMRKATEALRRREDVVSETVEPTETPPEVDLPAIAETASADRPEPKGQPSFEEEMAIATGEPLPDPDAVEQNESFVGDIGTSLKIGGTYLVKGSMVRSESERSLREVTRDKVIGQLSEGDRAGIAKMGGKKVSDMSWQELDRAATKFYGKTGEGFLGKRYVWNNMLREMMGFREGDHDEPSGAEAFPGALDLIGGSMKSGYADEANPITGIAALNPVNLNFQRAYENIARPIMEGAGVDTAEEALQVAEDLERFRQEYTDAARVQDETPFLNPEATANPLTWLAGPTKNLRGIFNATVEQAPILIGMAVGGKLGGKGGASIYTRSRRRPNMLMEEVQNLQKTGARIGGATVGGQIEMALIRDGVFTETQSRIENDTTDEMWAANEDYQMLIASGMTPVEAKQIVGYSYANSAGDMAMVISGALLGTPMGAFYGSTVGRSAGRQAAKDSILKQMGKGALYETGQEMAQEGTEQIAGNLAVMRINPDVGVFEGVAESMAAAAFTSAPYGALGGIRSDKGAGVGKDYDTMIRESQPWVNAANERWKFQNKKGPNTKFAKDASAQDQYNAMLELERLVEKEANAFLAVRNKIRDLMVKNGSTKDKLLEHDQRVEKYKKDAAMIAKRRKDRQISKKQVAQEKRAMAEREAARAQVERDVLLIDDNIRLVDNMTAIQKGEMLDQQGYEELIKAGYGTWNQRGDTFMLTQRGVRAKEELAKEAVDLRDKIDSGFSEADRREDRKLREAYQNLTEEEFEDQVMRDADTKLWNKRKWNQDRGDGKAVAVIDADSLKWINDNMSHSAGTEMLRRIANEIESLGGGATAYRYGGDEFIVTHSSPERLQAMVEKAVARINNLPRLEEAGKSVKIQVSVGYGADFDTADLSLQEEKTRRVAAGERIDTRVEGAAPPSARITEAEESPQMTLFAMSKDFEKFNDDQLSDPDNKYVEEDWDEYVMAGDMFYQSQLFGNETVSEQEMSWIEETVEDYLPSTNAGNPPITLVHDFTWLKKISPNQFEEMLSLNFGAQYVRGIFSMDDPSHGVFLFADAMIGEAKRGLRPGMRTVSFSSLKYRLQEQDTVEVIDADGKIRRGTVVAFTKKKQAWEQRKPYGAYSQTQAEKRLAQQAIKSRQKLNKLRRREETLLKQRKKMKPEKRDDKDHPVNQELMINFEKQNQMDMEIRMFQSAMLQERNNRWNQAQTQAEQEAEKDTAIDSISVSIDGEVITFDPNANRPLSVLSGRPRGTEAGRKKSQEINRREFLKAAAAVLGSSYAPPKSASEEEVFGNVYEALKNDDGRGEGRQVALSIIDKNLKAYEGSLRPANMSDEAWVRAASQAHKLSVEEFNFELEFGDVMRDALGAKPGSTQERQQAEESLPDLHLGRFKHKGQTKWYDNLGNEEAAEGEKLTKEHVARVVADTVMHETVGHFGIRGLTKDYESYIKLTHAMVDAFPEVVDALRSLGYNYRTDINKGEDLNRANKALLGEEVMAWKAGELLADPSMKGMTLPQQSAIQRFLTWFREQLIQLGWGKYERKFRAAKIRAARRRMYNASSPYWRNKARKELYGDGDQQGLVYIGSSGQRKGGYVKGKGNQKKGVVVRSSTGFLNDKDLLGIIARSHDAIVNGHAKWKFKDFHGQDHNLYMRDMEIFRKPIYDVLLNGTRERTEEEILSEEDLAPAPPVPTMAEAYEQITGEAMPEGWRPLTPGDFKDESKRLEAEEQARLEAEGVTGGELKKAMGMFKKENNPKALYDKATGEMSEEERGLAGKVQSVISQAKKEVERKQNLIRSKKAKIEAGERQYGEDFNQDRIPVFPEIGSVSNFVEAAKAALPSSKGYGSISEMELEAAGFMDRVWPSRLNSVIGDSLTESDIDAIYEKIGIPAKRIDELRKPNVQMTEKEAKQVVAYMKQANERNEALGFAPDFTEQQMDEKVLMQNNNLAVADFVPLMGSYALSQQDPVLTTMNMLLGDNHPTTEAYKQAIADLASADPDDRQKARNRMQDLINAPIDVVKTQIPKQWVASQIETPVYEISVSAPIRVARDWKDIYEKLYGKDQFLEDDNYDMVPRDRKAAIRKEQERDRIEGPDIGFDEQLGRWITVDADYETKNYYPSLMPLYTIAESYKGAVFWQKPKQGVRSGHYNYAVFQDEGESADYIDSAGLWGHARYSENYDADPNAPLAPNPAKQGRAMQWHESQADHIQRSAKRYESDEAEDAATKQNNEDANALSSAFNNYFDLYHQRLRTMVEEDWNLALDRIDDEDFEAYLDDVLGPAKSELSAEDRELAKQLHVANLINEEGTVENLMPSLNEFFEAVNLATQDLDEGQIGMAASNWNFYQDQDEMTRAGYTGDPIDVAFIGDARMFEWNDNRAMTLIMNKVRAVQRQYEDQIFSFGSRSQFNKNLDRLKMYYGGSLISSAPGSRTGKWVRAVSEEIANPGSNNMPGHRIPFMQPLAKKVLTEFLQRVDPDLNATAIEDQVERQFNEVMNQKTIMVRVPLDEISDQIKAALGRDVTPSTLSQYLRIHMDSPWAKQFSATSSFNSNTGVANVSGYGSEQMLKTFADEFVSTFLEYIRTKQVEAGTDEINKKIKTLQKQLKDRWNRGRTGIDNWRNEFNIQFAHMRIGDTADEPFIHKNNERANGLSIEEAQALQEKYEVENFREYTARQWKTEWEQADQDERDAYEAEGGNETTPTPNWYERYAEMWNDSTPGVIRLTVPDTFDEDGIPNSYRDMVFLKKQVGARRWTLHEVISDDEGAEGLGDSLYTMSWNNVTDMFGDYIYDDYQNRRDRQGFEYFPNRNSFAVTRDEDKGRKKEIEELEKRKGEDFADVAARFDDAFENQQFTTQEGSFDNLEESFLRLIDFHKKTGVQQKIMIERNEQWRTTQILWAFTEAVRNGYARMHLAPGSESGSRGGYGRDVGSVNRYMVNANEAGFQLTTKTIRGQKRDIIILNADTITDPVWVDVTEDQLLPLNPDRGMPDVIDDPNEGYFSPALARQVGRDVAEAIATKMREGDQSVDKKTLLISKTSWDSLSQQQLLESHLIHDEMGNVIEIAASKEEAEAARERIYQKGAPQPNVDAVRSGKVTDTDVGGPIQFNRTYYAGSPAYQYKYGNSDRYQHTFARPSFEGGRANYDMLLPARINGYLKRFGMKIEEGYAKVEKQDILSVMYAGGGRVSYNVPEAVTQNYPNIAVDEIRGENFGYIINSDNGIVIPTVFSSRSEAERQLDNWLTSQSTDESGRVKVFQITFNDEFRKAHMRPQNPFLGVKYQVNSNEQLKNALSKIGTKQPSLLDRFNDWRTTWKASVNIGMFDRFYGILYALRMTGSDIKGYKLTRMTTGLDAIMKGVFEYGSPVWRDGVVVNEGRGLLKILEPVAEAIDLWAGYMAGVRAKRLLMEGYNNLGANDKKTLDVAAAAYPGADFDEKLFNLLVDATKRMAEQTEAEEEADKPVLLTRRDVLKGLAAFGVASQTGLPGSNRLAEAAADIVMAQLKGSRFSGRRSSKWRNIDPDRIVDPIKAFRKPEAAKNRWVKELMNAQGVSQEEAQSAVDSAIKQALEDQLVKDAAQKAKEKLEEPTKGNLTPNVNEAVNKMIAAGRERLFTPADIQELVALGDDFPVFTQVADDYAEFNKKMLDFAEESGVINPETRPLWEEADYIPFYRIADDRLVGPLAKTNGVANQNSPTSKHLKGGTQNLGDLVHNIFMNATNLMDSSIKNNAAREVVDALVPTGLMTAQKVDESLVDMEEIRKVMARNDMNLDDLEEEVQKGLQTMFSSVPVVGANVISILRDGKKEYYRTDDELLFRSLAAVNMEAFSPFAEAILGPSRFTKRFLTASITLDPGFMAANYVRDTMSAWVLGRDKFIPLVSGVKGFKEAITEGDSYRAMVASGAAFESGLINQGDPKSTRKYINSKMRDAGFQRTLLNTPRKLLNAWKRVGSATENANRIAIYQAAKAAGKSELDALYEAKDIMDFSMGGDWKAIQILIQTVPFMGARMQGLHRLGRGVREHPGAFFMKGAVIGIAGMGLWLKYREDPRYDELEDWDKDAYFHFWIGDQHFRIPKGFEVGAIFNTMPERMMEFIYSQETDAGKFLLRRYGHMLLETFNMNPIPQVVKPAIEVAANYDFFRKRSIESPYERQLLPEDRYSTYTSETMRALSAAMPESFNTKFYGDIKSPKQLEFMWNGYTGTLGRIFLNIADVGMRHLLDYPVAPDWDISDLPVLSRFYRGDRPRRTRYEEEFYRELSTAVEILGSMNKAERGGNDPRFDELDEYYGDYVERAQELQQYKREIALINKDIRELQTDEKKDRKQKRKEIDELQLEKNEIFKEAYEQRPASGKDEEEKTQTRQENIESLMDSYNVGAPEANQDLRVQAPQTSELMDGVGGMSPDQMNRLIKSVNYTPNEKR